MYNQKESENVDIAKQNQKWMQEKNLIKIIRQNKIKKLINCLK